MTRKKSKAIEKPVSFYLLLTVMRQYQFQRSTARMSWRQAGGSFQVEPQSSVQALSPRGEISG
jgi:hypothetical protein